ncbi:hypothetical protein B0J13DRAFT_50914 [Dactylonectria estremocensis]|uniref:Nephrocystin 3-like N-terminal domain-containing protein n=1 Tax=Dactylonectria estremocensis TaxID=1079267 RepID=A0A9P9ERT7_9HYPO|nr:hypothetical protein B0J13DRAFT_50914 [Dactylonectria estremocensis]
MIWYQVVNSDGQYGEATGTEYEDIPVSFLGDLEKFNPRRRKEPKSRGRPRVRKQRRRNARGKKRETPSTFSLGDSEVSRSGYFGGRTEESKRIRKRLYLFYVAPENDQLADDADLSPFQSMLWSLVTQVLVWRSRLIGVFLGWLGAIKPDLDRLEKVPGSDQLKMFLRSLLECLGIPVVITVCHIERISDVRDPQSLQFLADLGSNQSGLGVPVHIILSSPENGSMPPEIQKFQALNRNTERSECLNDFKFEGQYLRRDEVSVADEGTNTWIWNHPSFVKWADQPSGILWIEGKAGSGKSVLAKTILQLSTVWGTNRRATLLPQVSDWFYSSRHGDLTRSHMSFLRSILAQLLEQNQDAFSLFVPVYRDKKKENNSWEMGDYERILKTLATHGLPAACIVDALDESELGADVFFRLREHVVELLTGLVDTPSSRLRIIVLSRYTPDIDRSFRRWSKQEGKLSHITLEQENARNIACLVDHGMAVLKKAMDDFDSESDDEMEDLQLGYLPRRIPVRQETTNETFSRMRSFLVTNAQGVILWV